jgi:hypothetical protein
MPNLQHDETCASIKERIADILELVILDTLLSVLDELLERQDRGQHVINHE